MFDEEFYSGLPDDPASAAFYLVTQFVKFNDNFPNNTERLKQYESYINAAGICQAFIEILEVSKIVPQLTLTSSHSENIKTIVEFFANASKAFSEKKINFLSNHARDILTKKFESLMIYKFTEGDIKRIQELINELREKISESDFFSDNHKSRLLKRLEELQKELHKKMSSVDKFWGFVMDAGPVLGKFGKDAKPLFDRINELAEIIFRAQSVTQELPSSTPLPLLFHDKIEEK